MSPTLVLSEPSRGYWHDASRRFRKDRAALFAGVFLAVLAAVALLAPIIVGVRPIVCRYKGNLHFPILEYYYRGGEDPIFQRDGFRGEFPRGLRAKDPESWAIWPLIFDDPCRRVVKDQWPGRPSNDPLEPPSLRHLFGTDAVGLDVFARVIYGARTALLVGLVSMSIAGTIGLILGALAGYFGGIIDITISRLVELLMAVPTLVLILALVSVIQQPGIFHLMAIVGLTRWESIARYTRGEVLRLKEREFVLAAKALGAPWHRILFRHILPNALAPFFVTVTFGVANAILIESALSFLGFGVPPPTPSWGALLQGWYGSQTSWWLALFPGLAVFLTVLAFNMAGDGLQEALDPRLRR